MEPQITTLLMFEGRAEEAMNLYTEIFDDAQIEQIDRYGPGEAGAPGSVRHATFRLGSQTLRCIDSPVEHAFTFTAAMSLFVDCESRSIVEDLFTALSDGGTILMPLEEYPFSGLFGWLTDRFGVSWQLNLAS
jgi:predicted 3-demethylubiquinone-9 3-methyltransferase (glyoxalase superfamily)